MGWQVSAWLGPLGNLVEFAHYKGSASVDLDRKVVFTETIGGGRFGQASPTTGLRTWAMSATYMDPSQWAGFELLAMGAYGNQHVFLEPLALVTNVISPLKSLPGLGGSASWVSGDNSPSGLVAIEGGTRVPTVRSGGGSMYMRFDAPVMPGKPVTVSVYALGSSVRMNVSFIDASGTYVGSGGSVTQAMAGGSLRRLSRSIVAPPTAAAVYISVTGASVAAAPAVTWTNTLMPWARGRGCEKAVIHGVGDSTVLAGGSAGRQFANFDFTVTEVGYGD